MTDLNRPVSASPVVERCVTEPIRAAQVFYGNADFTCFRNPTIRSFVNLDFLMSAYYRKSGFTKFRVTLKRRAGQSIKNFAA